MSSYLEPYKLTNEESQKDLLLYLRKLGILLWYDQHLATRNKIILNPEWVTTALYRIIDSKDIRDKNGKLEQKDIENLWNEDIYMNYHNELVEILKIFRLAYERKHKKEYIVPSLMNTKITSKYEKWTPENNWTIKYTYPRLMPRGIVNQLAAELCKNIDSDFEDVWAFGVVFTIKNAKAKVEQSKVRKQIEIKVFGDNRLKLMQEINTAMQEIHHTYKNLEYDIEIPCNCEKCQKSSDDDKTHYYYKRDIIHEIEDNREDIYCRNIRKETDIAPILRCSGFALPYKLTEMIEKKKTKENDIKEIVIRIEDNSKEMLKNQKGTDEKIDIVISNTNEIKSMMENQFNYLLKLVKNSNLKKDEIISAIEEITKEEQEKALEEMLKVLKDHHSKIDEKYNNIFDSIKNPETSLDMKLKLSIPLINLIGIDIGIEGGFDIKAWAKNLYDKLGFQVFKLLIK